MPGVARLNDIGSGHGPCPPRPNIQASSNVIVNGRGAHRQSDAWAIHCKHGSVLAAGSPNVIVNNKQIGRCNDPVACGSVVATCSSNVIAN